VSTAEPSAGLGREERRAISTDLTTLAVLHDREPDSESLARLRQAPFQDWLGLRLTKPESGQALAFFDEALAGLPEPLDEVSLDELAADFARIYLGYRYKVAATESVWLTEENLVMQEPMFEIREAYAHYGLEVENWRTRSDDHLVLQLAFLAHVIAQEDRPYALIDAGRFMDAHILQWIQAFARRVTERAEQAYYAGLALATACYLDELRDLLVAATGEARRDTEIAEKIAPQQEPDEARDGSRFVPGTGPTW